MTEQSMPEESIFTQAVEIKSAEKRAAFLDQACGANRALRALVETLLRAHERVGELLDLPDKPAATVDKSFSTDRAGVVIGPYKLLEKIGEGGMGTVWMAQQQEPVKRLVALKLIKAGMDSRQVIARFEAERQALALMDHPNIAKVLDGGTVGHVFNVPESGHVENVPHSGRPYFVMDLVKGVPITKYCDEHHLTPRQRLELFIPVCQAIQHAHQKGIIHRDLKPSNVLVALYDGRPVPKVIDFGVAKATGQQLTDKTLVTGFGAIVGTLEYMSPEQAESNQLDVDTRSDIYSLGVLLYELLTGSPPFTLKELEKAGLMEMLRVIREKEPSKPSTRLSTAEGLPTLAANRGTEPAKLTRLLRGELDWIAMKALEKDRARRYETANGFALDVQRYLADEPVLAGPPSAWYRFRKFARRNRVHLALAAVLALLLLGGGAFAWYTERQATERQAEEDIRHREEQARLSQNAEAVAALLDQCEAALRADDADRAALALGAAERRAADGGAEELADRLARCGGDLKLLRELDVINTLRWSWAGRDFPAKKVLTDRWRTALVAYGVTLEEARAKEAAAGVNESLVRDRLLGVLEVLLAIDRSPGVRAVLQAADPDSYRDAVRNALKSRDSPALVALANQPEALTQPARFAAVLGWTHPIPEDRGRAVMESALRRRPGDLTLLMQLGVSYSADQPETAGQRLRWFQAALAAHPGNQAALNNLGIALRSKGDPDGAIAHLKAATLRDPNFVNAHFNLGQAQHDKGQLDEAIASFSKVVELDPKDAEAHCHLGIVWLERKDPEKARAAYTEGVRLDPKFARGHYYFGRALDRNGDTDGAIAAFRKAIESNPDYFDAHLNLGAILCDAKRDYAGAINAFNEALRINPKEATAHFNLGNALDGKGDIDGAIAAYRQALKINPDYADAHVNLAGILSVAKGDKEAAFFHLKEALRINPKRADAHSNLGYVLRSKADFVGAEKSFREALRLKPDDYVALHGLFLVLGPQGKLDQALPLLQEAAADMEKDRFRHKRAASIVDDLISCHEHLKQLDQVEIWRRKWMAVVKERAGAASLPYGSELASLGSNLLRQRKWIEAEPVLRESMEIGRKKASGNWGIFDVQSMLGAALLGQKRYADAESMLLEGYAGMKRQEKAIPPEHKARITEGILRLVQLYDATEKKEDAEKWRALLEQREGTRVGAVHDVGDGLKLDGQLDGKSSALVFEVRLSAGKTYVIDMVSPDPKALDPYLVLKDAHLEHLAEDDDSGGGLNARIVYRAPRDGVYRVHATSYGAGRGAFTLMVREKK